MKRMTLVYFFSETRPVTWNNIGYRFKFNINTVSEFVPEYIWRSRTCDENRYIFYVEGRSYVNTYRYSYSFFQFKKDNNQNLKCIEITL